MINMNKKWSEKVKGFNVSRYKAPFSSQYFDIANDGTSTTTLYSLAFSISASLISISVKSVFDNMLVPFWSWQDKSQIIYQLLCENRDNQHIKFKLDLVKDCLKLSHCYISTAHTMSLY